MSYRNISEKDLEKLKKQLVYARRRIRGTNKTERLELDAYSTTDREYLEWMIKKMGTLGSCNRLRFRLETLKILDKLSLLQVML